MSKVVRKQAHFLQLLKDTASAAQRKALLDTITKEQLLALTEVTYNLLHGPVSIKESHKKQLQRNQKFIRLLGDPKTGTKQKRRALCHRGKIVATVLKAVEPLMNTIL